MPHFSHEQGYNSIWLYLQLMLQFNVNPLQEYHGVITFILIISVTYHFKTSLVILTGNMKYLFLSSRVRQMDFSSRHALIQDRAENIERCAGGGALLYVGGEIHPVNVTC